jgi:hypothetical protein
VQSSAFTLVQRIGDYSFHVYPVWTLALGRMTGSTECSEKKQIPFTMLAAVLAREHGHHPTKGLSSAAL